MKRHVQFPGIRKWSGSDLVELQSEGLSIVDKFFSQYGNCVICGCSISGKNISSGLVSIGGIVMPFDAATGIEVFPVYLVKGEKHVQREYADNVARDVMVEFYAKIQQQKPEGDYIEVSAANTSSFFDNIDSKWLSDILEHLEYLDTDNKDIWDELNQILKTPTLSSPPTDTTLTYKSGESTRNFVVGQQCRVYDTNGKRYVFYQLYNIAEGDKADWQIVATDGSAFAETVKINISSNQGLGDTSLDGASISIIYQGAQTDLVWLGAELSVSVPIDVEYQIVCGNVPGYLSPDTQEHLAIGGGKRQVTLMYSTEKVTVDLSTDDGADCSGRTVQVINVSNSEIVGSGKGSSIVIKIPFGINYKIRVDDFVGYQPPTEQSYTANYTARYVTFLYEKIVDASIVFDRSISDSANITGEINTGSLATILSKFRRCLCKKTAGREVTIAYLKDTDSNYYEDGTAAVLNGDEGDVMVDFPEFYYKYEMEDTNRYRYRFALYNIDGEFKHVPRSLVGAYKAYQADGKLYSRSGVSPTVGMIFADFSNCAKARGVGYQLIDFQQHCVIAFMLYAKYGNRNLQAILGIGGANYIPVTITGTTNQKGNRDTLAEMSGYVNGLGIEGVFGGLIEFVQGVTILGSVWTISDPDGTQRDVNAFEGEGWITSVTAESGPFFDMVPSGVGGSETTYYSDQCYIMEGGPFYLARSFYSAYTVSGVSFVAGYPASEKGVDAGSRLAFRGVIHEASSIDAFRLLPAL